jgi:UDPglucose--hexose-1-phosphate uridylyltransferase
MVYHVLMTELRRDIFTGRWVIVDRQAALQASDFDFHPFLAEPGPCDFCEGHESATPPELYAARPPETSPNAPGWTVRIVPNLRPRLHVEGSLDPRAEGFHDLMNGIGVHEIVVETARHDRSLHQLEPPAIADVLRAWGTRITDLRRDDRIRHVLIFKNHGAEAGARTSSHSISHLMGLPVTPRTVKAKLTVARDYFTEKERCIYCDVLRQELEDGRRLIAANHLYAALAPFASRFPFEMMILPKRHAAEFATLEGEGHDALARLLHDVLRKLDRAVPGAPYNLALHDSPRRRHREGYWTTLEEDFHWHVEILPQLWPIAGFEWASGFFYNPTPPEAAARRLAELSSP